jgi:cytochrome P450
MLTRYSVAGSDTTATAIRSTLLHVTTTPRVLTRLRQEIDDTYHSAPVIRDDEARHMPFLQAVIKEGLRIFPPVAGLMAKEAPPEGHLWKGHFIPGGTRIGSCAWGIFRREDIWGTDAQEFRPERWLESTPEKLHEMEGTLELIFSYGRWQCLGRPIALIELNKILVQVRRLPGHGSLIRRTSLTQSTSCYDNLKYPSAIRRILGRYITVAYFLRMTFM